MELKPEEEYDIFEKYQTRLGDYVTTWGVFMDKGRDGKYHKCSVALKKVYKPVKMDDNVLLAIQKAEIKGLNEEIERLKVEYKLTALTNQIE